MARAKKQHSLNFQNRKKEPSATHRRGKHKNIGEAHKNKGLMSAHLSRKGRKKRTRKMKSRSASEIRGEVKFARVRTKLALEEQCVVTHTESRNQQQGALCNKEGAGRSGKDVRSQELI